MPSVQSLIKTSCLLIASAFTALGLAAETDISTIPLNTYSAASSTDVKPNVFFVLDDSGSMDWDFMPDWACGPQSTRHPACTSPGQDPSSARSEFLFRNSAYNGVYYNPAVVYKPPVAVGSSGTTNTTTFPNMTGASTATGADSSTKPNWKAVKDDAYGVQSGSSVTSDITSSAKPPYFFTIIPGEYCTSASLRTCSTTASATYSFPAKVRWCDSSALTNCRATFDSTFSWVRAPSPRAATITVAGTVSSSASGITVNSLQIMSGASAASGSSSTVATNIVAKINACTISITGNCQTVGYSAVASGNIITITAPDANSFTPVTSVTPLSGGMTFTSTAFSAGMVPGENLRTTITSTVNSYPYAGATTKAVTRTDCTGTTCSYIEEMTNYANWWTYYKSRMQMMKTATSNAFANVDTATDIANSLSRFRLGYMTINNNNSSDFLNIDEFKTTQKYNWYTKLLSANPSNSTPLRRALANAGRLYAGKLNGTTFNGTEVVDPLQYSCQQNYTILSTDGFWNDRAGYKMNASTAVGNQDGTLERPYRDTSSTQIQSRTSSLQSQTVTPQFQSRTSTLQSVVTSTAPPIQKRTSADSGSTWTDWAIAGSCTLDTTGSTRTDCQVPKATSTDSGVTYTPWTTVNSCTAVSSGSNRTVCSGSVSSTTNTSSCTVGSGTTCQYTSWTGWSSNTASCTALPQSSTSPYTVATATQCQTGSPATAIGSWINASSCTASSTQNCQYTSWGSWSNVAACAAVAQSTSPNYTVATARDCQTVASGGTSDTLADVASYYYQTDLRSPVAADGTGTCTGPVISPATTANDLCANNVPSSGRDVANTQHMTTFTLGLGAQGQMVNAPVDGKDYWNDTSGDFYSIETGETANPSTGICAWQTSGVCSWPIPAADSNANIDDLWHAAINGHGTYFSASDPASLSASLASALTSINATPRPGTAAAAASSNPNVSATDNYVFSSSYKSVEWYGELIRQQITATGLLTNQNWSAMKLLDCATTSWSALTSYVEGQVYRQGTACYSVTSDYVSGATFDSSASGVDGSKVVVVNVDEVATPLVPATPLTSRTIYTKSSSGLIPFQWSNLVTAGLSTYFTKPAITYVSATAGLSQFCATGSCLSATAQNNDTIATGGAAGEALVNFLRGDRSNENTFFRKRTHILGDIVSSEARYVEKPLFSYTDTNYAEFKTLKSSRVGAVYVGANDGMLHAFNGATGQENWAYIPGIVLPDIHRIADKNYATGHQYLVDGSPEVGDICPNAPASTCSAAQWKTIIVGGLNRGGKGFYALDITDPATPVALWEFRDTNLGYSYGNPRITKLKDGTWVVLLTSGYNNADGLGRLYVLNANTGALIRSISTGVGSAGTPSGVARISSHSLTPTTDNTATAAYGGDTFGNLWRFDINGDIGAAGYDAQLLVSFKDAAGKAQPITAKPLEATVNGKPVIYIGTGRYLGVTDVTNTDSQTFYAVKDNLDAVTYGNPRTASSNFVRQTVTSTTCPAGTPTTVCIASQAVRTSTSAVVDWSTKNGWYIDFLTGGERASTDPTLGLGSLLFTTITPQASTASACGDATPFTPSFVYVLDYLTGGAVTGSNGVSAISLGAGLVTRPVLIKQSDGTTRALIRKSGGAGLSGTDMGGTVVITPTIKPPASSMTRRVSWRELTTK